MSEQAGQILVNGEPAGTVAANDRGLAFGDGLFETVLIHAGRPILLDAHLERLALGCARLDIPLDENLVTQDIKKIFSIFEPQHAVLKLIYTRGAGGRGYRPAALPPTRLLSLHPAPPALPVPIKAFVCRQRLALQSALAGIKHLNRLEQILASREWPGDDYHEGLMLSTAGNAIEGTRSNLFVALGGRWCTPDLDACGIDGVMRAHLLQRWQGKVDVAPLGLQDVLAADELVFCNSVTGILPVATLRHEGGTRRYESGKLCASAQAAFAELLRS